MEKKEYKFQKLTPINDIKLGVYKDAIDFIFANEDINNIAITGSYGSGKSSVIESYKNLQCNDRQDDKLQSKKEFIHISLAYIPSNNSSDQDNINQLEGKVINTLIQQINPNKIPHSSFQRMLGKDREVHKNKSIFLSVFILSSFILFYKRLIQDIFFIPQFMINFGIRSDYFFIINFIMWSYMLYRSLHYLLNYFARKPLLKRIKILNNEIELFEKKDEDYFNKYLNEIIYLFKYCGVDAIVFEDIDRFNMKEIFIKLREINFLVNRQLLNEGKKPLKFIYLLKDDLFESKERTKFFDYIIPIIPIADASNSCDYLLEFFKDKSYFKSVDEKLFLKEISLYIDDMRLIKNIYNEFEIYKERLEKRLKLNHEVLFATIVYKNIFPNDFNKFQYNEGYVYSVLQKIADIKQKKIDECDSEIANVYDELDNMYRFYDHDYNEADEEYYEHFEQEMLEEKIVYLEEKRNRLFNHDLVEILQNANIDLFDEKFEKINNLDDNYLKNIKNDTNVSLLRFLLYNDYLNEFTREYISYFKEGMLTVQEKVFIKGIKNRMKQDYNIKLKNIDVVLTWIRSYEYKHESILNYDLFRYFLENEIKNPNLSTMIQQLKNSNNKDFIVNFLLNSQPGNIAKYLNLIAEVYPDFIGDLYSSEAKDIPQDTKNNLNALAMIIFDLSVSDMWHTENIDNLREKLSSKSIEVIEKIMNFQKEM